MKNLLRIFILLVLLFILSYSLQAQVPFAKLVKNKNVQAKDLNHFLNASGDTLILNSKTKINSLYTINKSSGKEYDIYINARSFHFPLNKLSKGKHVLVAVQSPKQIVFVVHVFGDDNTKTAEIKSTASRTEVTKLATVAND